MTALLAAALLTLIFPQAVAADDDDPPGRVARLNYLQGSVSFQPAGESEWVSAVTNRPVTTGDRLWADSGARAELHIGSATIRLDSGTGFSFLNLDDRTVQIQLTEGTIDIRVQRLGRDEIFEVDTPNQAFSILRPGQYRLQASEDGDSTIVIVRSGEGEATGAGQIYSLHSGQSGTFTGTDSLYGDIYNAGDNDDFDTWGEGRDRHDDNSQSARYVSSDVVGYQDLDDYGSWRSDPGYGNVWVPTRVASGWAPYRDGHWAWISPWGWTWVDDAPWGYAPFHYGRWVSFDGNWGWIPGPREIEPVYAPALVVFIGGSQFGEPGSRDRGGFGGNVGWFPLGPREVYVPGYNASRGYVDRVNVSNTIVTTTTITTVYNNQVTNKNTNITYVNKTVRGGVTAVPQSAFTGAQSVARAAVVVNAQQIASAPVISRAEVVPTRNSVLGTSGAVTNRVAQPSAAIANRSVVAKATPPPPPVPFAKQQQALAVHPGAPLARHEVEGLRPANVAVAHSLVRQAPPGKPATLNTNRPVAAKPGQPGNARPANAPENKPPNAQPSNTEANAPANPPQPGRDRPASVRPDNPISDRHGPENPGQPVNARPTNANQPGNPVKDVPATPAQPAHNDRLPSTQPSNPPSGSGGRPGAEVPGQPVNAQSPNTPANRPGNPQRDVPTNRPQPAHNDRPPSVQPNNPPSGNRPGAENPEPQVNTQPPNTPANRPGNPQKDVPTNRPQPAHNDRPPSVQPNNPPSGNRPGAENPEPQVNAQPPNAAANRRENPPRDEPASKPVTSRDNRPQSEPGKSSNPLEPAKGRAKLPDPPEQPSQPGERRPSAQPPHQPKVEPTPQPEVTPNPPLTPAEKAREEQKKREAKLPPQ